MQYSGHSYSNLYDLFKMNMAVMNSVSNKSILIIINAHVTLSVIFLWQNHCTDINDIWHGDILIPVKGHAVLFIAITYIHASGAAGKNS